ECEISNTVREQVSSTVDALLGPLYNTSGSTETGRQIYNKTPESLCCKGSSTSVSGEILGTNEHYGESLPYSEHGLGSFHRRLHQSAGLEPSRDLQPNHSNTLDPDSLAGSASVYAEIPDTPPPPAPPSIANRIPLQHIRHIGQKQQQQQQQQQMIVGGDVHPTTVSSGSTVSERSEHGAHEQFWSKRTSGDKHASIIISIIAIPRMFSFHMYMNRT
ncbi:hypothetical protein BIW11_05991, partial [Tropilaelaps mercedesae]